MTTRTITHLVDVAQLYANPVKAFCGEEGLTMGAELYPDDFDFVFTPDRRCLCDCGPCLAEAAQRRSKTTSAVTV